MPLARRVAGVDRECYLLGYLEGAVSHAPLRQRFRSELMVVVAIITIPLCGRGQRLYELDWHICVRSAAEAIQAGLQLARRKRCGATT